MKKLIISIILWIMLLWESTFADYQPNIDDEVRLYNFTRNLLLRIEKFENTEEFKKSIQNKMLELSWETKTELEKHYRIWEKEYSSFREYAIKYIYNHIDYNINEYYISWEWKILENSFARVFVNLSDIYITEKWVFSGTRNLIEFFKTDENIEDFINNTIREKEFQEKCTAIKHETKWAIFTENQVYRLWWIWPDKPRTKADIIECWEYWSGFSIRYFERRWDYIIYINAGQDFNGLFFRFIEMK